MVRIQGQDQTHSYILPAVYSLSQSYPTLILNEQQVGLSF
jgi:hypothetical protein